MKNSESFATKSLRTDIKKKVCNLAIIFTILISVMAMITGCGKKTENIIVYINDGLNESKINEIEQNLKELDRVNSISYTSKANAYEEAKEKLGQNAMEISGFTKEYHPFPAYFTVEVKKNKNYDEIIKKIEGIEGVKTVVLEATAEDSIKEIINNSKLK